MCLKTFEQECTYVTRQLKSQHKNISFSFCTWPKIYIQVLIKHFFFFLIRSRRTVHNVSSLTDWRYVRTSSANLSIYPEPARVLTNEGTFNILMKSPQEVSKHKNPRDTRNTRGTALTNGYDISYIVWWMKQIFARARALLL